LLFTKKINPLTVTGILHLHDQLVDKINSDGTVKGALQLVQLRPFFVVSYMESSVRLYDTIATHPNSVLSWDATGGIVKCFPSTNKQILYYELTLAHPNMVNEDTLIPLTFTVAAKIIHTISFLIKDSQNTNFLKFDGYQKNCHVV
jgi:hypothetical protein